MFGKSNQIPTLEPTLDIYYKLFIRTGIKFAVNFGRARRLRSTTRTQTSKLRPNMYVMV